MSNLRQKMNQLIPEHMHSGLLNYIEHGIGPGGFLTAVLSNDLIGAFMRADERNTYAMRDWVDFVYNYAPATCHGSPEAVDAWIKKGGTKG